MRAAAFCENGSTDSAKQIINNLDSIRIIEHSTLNFCDKMFAAHKEAKADATIAVIGVPMKEQAVLVS